MHNIRTNSDKILKKIKPLTKDLSNQARNVLRSGVRPKFSELQIMALAIRVEALSML